MRHDGEKLVLCTIRAFGLFAREAQFVGRALRAGARLLELSNQAADEHADDTEEYQREDVARGRSPAKMRGPQVRNRDPAEKRRQDAWPESANQALKAIAGYSVSNGRLIPLGGHQVSERQRDGCYEDGNRVTAPRDGPSVS